MPTFNIHPRQSNLDFERLDKVEPNDLILVSEQSILDSIKKRFDYVLIDDKNPVSLIRIQNSKSDSGNN